MVVATMSGINLMGSWMIRNVARAVNTLLALSGMPKNRHAPNVAVETNTGDIQKTTESYALRYNTLDSHFISTSRRFSICSLNLSSHACKQPHITFTLKKTGKYLGRNREFNEQSGYSNIVPWHRSSQNTQPI